MSKIDIEQHRKDMTLLMVKELQTRVNTYQKQARIDFTGLYNQLAGYFPIIQRNSAEEPVRKDLRKISGVRDD